MSNKFLASVRITYPFLSALLLSGCASIPDVTYKYYPATWSSVVTVTQTVMCDAATNVHIANTPTVSTAYTRDWSEREPFSLKLKELQTISADAEVAMDFTEDGRLKGINHSSTGQGETIIKSVVSLAAALGMPMVADASIKAAAAPPPAETCRKIAKWAGDKPVPVNLIYRATIKPENLGKSVRLVESDGSKAIRADLADALPELMVSVGAAQEVASGPSFSGTETDVVLLKLQKIATVQLMFHDPSAMSVVGSSTILVPMKGDTSTYNLPIPKAALFGKQSFALKLSESGAVVSVSYGKNVGAAGALNALTSLQGAGTAAETAETASLRAQADRIAQQQRLMLCQTKPDQCK